MGTIVSIAFMSAGLLSAGERFGVQICNYGKVRDSTLIRAKAETEAIFRSSAVTIEWRDCEDPPAVNLGMRWFLLRLRSDAGPATAGSSSLDDMGRAFVSDRGEGYLVDAYFRSIEDHARPYQADPGRLLGQVMAHELGHLLLGPGHSRHSIMRAKWTLNVLTGLHQQWMTLPPRSKKVFCGNCSAPQGRISLDRRGKWRMPGQYRS